jgi:chaperonin GroES
MNIRPLGDRALVQNDKVMEKSAGGILLPGAQQDRIVFGTVVAVGSGKPNEDTGEILIPVKVGDRVIYDRAAGAKVKNGDEELLVIKFEELLGIVEN